MTTAVLRPFAPADMRPVVALWNRCLHNDPLTEERFWHQFLLDPNFDSQGTLVAEAAGEIIGFLQAMTRKVPLGSLGLQPQQGWITAFCVAPEWRRQGVASRLLAGGLDYLRAQGRTEVSCNGYSPYYVFPGVDIAYTEAQRFLEAKGFACTGEPVAMGMRLEGARMPAAVQQKQAELAQAGFDVRRFEREDTLPLLTFAERHFPHWRPSVQESLQLGHDDVFLAVHQGEIVAFAQWENPYNDPPHGAPGRFGPFGVRDDLRSRGIGAVLFYSLVEHVAGNGARYLWFGWAGGRNLSFYQRAGCIVTRQFRQYRRAL